MLDLTTSSFAKVVNICHKQQVECESVKRIFCCTFSPQQGNVLTPTLQIACRGLKHLIPLFLVISCYHLWYCKASPLLLYRYPLSLSLSLSTPLSLSIFLCLSLSHSDFLFYVAIFLTHFLRRFCSPFVLYELHCLFLLYFTCFLVYPPLLLVFAALCLR